jgi:hypothetical protein
VKKIICVLAALLPCLLSCGRPESTNEDKRPRFHNTSSNHVILPGAPRTSPAEVVPGETILDVP